ncbi:hypothetical protein NQZ79_g6903 [Umbelopsis isabellina]|nr:hypothetical protein NQZ79_g6903 [Umbelopsis isabellina]
MKAAVVACMSFLAHSAHTGLQYETCARSPVIRVLYIWTLLPYFSLTIWLLLALAYQALAGDLFTSVLAIFNTEPRFLYYLEWYGMVWDGRVVFGVSSITCMVLENKKKALGHPSWAVTDQQKCVPGLEAHFLDTQQLKWPDSEHITGQKQIP